jgi:hypothetical protein
VAKNQLFTVLQRGTDFSFEKEVGNRDERNEILLMNTWQSLVMACE